MGLDNSGSPCKGDGSVEKRSSPSFSSGLEPTGLDLSEETLDSESSDKTTEATSPGDAKNRSAGSEFIKKHYVLFFFVLHKLFLLCRCSH